MNQANYGAQAKPPGSSPVEVMAAGLQQDADLAAAMVLGEENPGEIYGKSWSFSIKIGKSLSFSHQALGS